MTLTYLFNRQLILHPVADHRRAGSGERRRSRVIIHFRDHGLTDLVFHRLNHFAGGRVLHHAHLPRNNQLVANLYADFFADIQDQRVAAHVGHQSIDLQLDSGNFVHCGVQLRTSVIHGLVDRFT